MGRIVVAKTPVDLLITDVRNKYWHGNTTSFQLAQKVCNLKGSELPCFGPRYTPCWIRKAYPELANYLFVIQGIRAYAIGELDTIYVKTPVTLECNVIHLPEKIKKKLLSMAITDTYAYYRLIFSEKECAVYRNGGSLYSRDFDMETCVLKFEVKRWPKKNLSKYIMEVNRTPDEIHYLIRKPREGQWAE